MTFSTYEDLMAAVEERRAGTLTLEVDLGSDYSQEYEDAKAELQQAKGLQLLAGEQPFMSDNIGRLEEKVAALKPASRSVWIRFKRLSIGEWSRLIKKQGLSPIDQYEEVLPSTFLGVYGSEPDDDAEPLSVDAALLSSKGDRGILSGGALHQVVGAFMQWQNSGGEVTIRPTRSGLV